MREPRSAVPIHNISWSHETPAELGDAWHQNVQPLERFEKLVSESRQASPQAKRKEIRVRIGLNIRAHGSEYVSPQGEKRIMLSSNRGENRKVMEGLERLGTSYAVVAPNPDGRVSVAEQLKGLRVVGESSLKVLPSTYTLPCRVVIGG